MPPTLEQVDIYSVQGLDDFTRPFLFVSNFFPDKQDNKAWLLSLTGMIIIIIRSSDKQCLICARHYSTCFVCINSFNSITVVTVIIPILQTMKLRHTEVKELAQVTQLVSGRARISTSQLATRATFFSTASLKGSSSNFLRMTTF